MNLRANTAVDVLIGPFIDKTDGNTTEDGLTLPQAEIKLSKNGQALAQKNDSTTAAFDDDGYYNCELDATDTNTEGQLVLIVHQSANALPVRHEYNIMAEAAWDSLYVAKDDGFMDVNIKTVGRTDTQETEANNLESACSNYSATRGLTGTALPAAAADAAGGVPVSDAGGLDLDGMNTNINDIETDTNELQGDWANGGRLDLLLDATLADTNELQGDWANGGRLDLLLDATLADTSELQADWVNGGRLDLIIDAILVDSAVIGAAGAGLTAVPWNSAWDAEVQSECADALTAYDPPTKAEMDSAHSTTDGKIDAVDDFVDTEIAAIKTDTAAILVDTGTTLPATLSTIDSEIGTVDTVVDAIKVITDKMVFTTTNQLDVQVISMATNSLTASAAAADFIGASEIAASASTEIADLIAADWVAGDASPLAIVAALKADAEWSNLATIDANIDAILVDTAVIGSAGAGLTAVPWNSAWDAEVQSECADALTAYGPPTNTQMEARTIATASYFDPATDKVILADAAHGGTSAVLTLERMVAASTTINEPAVKFTGNGTGAGLISTGGPTGVGGRFVGGGTTQNGIEGIGGSSSGSGMFLSGATYGLNLNGDDFYVGDILWTNVPPVNMFELSGDETAAENLESAFDDIAGTVHHMGIVEQGEAQSATSTSLVMRAGATFAASELVGARVVITSASAGDGQSREITANDGSDTLTVAAWATTPTGTIRYKIYAAVAGGSALTAAAIADAVWDETMAGHTTADTAGLVLNEWQDGGRLDLIIDSILADTNELQTDWVNGGRLDLLLDATLADTNELQGDWANGGRLDLLLDATLADTNELQGDWVNGGRLDLLLDASTATTVLTTAMTETYGSDGGTCTVAQALYEILQNLTEAVNIGTTRTVKKRDGSTTAATYTYDSASNPTSITRAT